MAVVSLSNIVAFFEDEPKLIGRGENAYKSSRVEQFRFDGTLGMIRGKVRSSLKDIVYTAEVWLVIVHVLCSTLVFRLRLNVGYFILVR